MSKKKTESVKIHEETNMCCVNIRSKDGKDGSLPEWTPEKWVKTVSLECCPGGHVVKDSGRAAPSIPFGVEVLWSTGDEAPQPIYNLMEPTELTLDGHAVVVTVWRSGLCPELNANATLLDTDADYMQSKMCDSVVCTVPQHWIVPDREYAPRKPSTSLFAGSPWYRIFTKFGKVKYAEVYFCTAQGTVQTRDKMVMVLVQFENRHDVKKCCEKLTNRYVEMEVGVGTKKVPESHFPALRVCNADLFKSRIGPGGFPKDGSCCGMPFEHPHSFLDYVLDMSRIMGGGQFMQQQLEAITALLRFHPEGNAALQNFETVSSHIGDKGRIVVDIVKKGSGNEHKIDIIPAFEILEQSWTGAPNYQAPPSGGSAQPPLPGMPRGPPLGFPAPPMGVPPPMGMPPAPPQMPAGASSPGRRQHQQQQGFKQPPPSQYPPPQTWQQQHAMPPAHYPQAQAVQQQQQWQQPQAPKDQLGFDEPLQTIVDKRKTMGAKLKKAFVQHGYTAVLVGIPGAETQNKMFGFNNKSGVIEAGREPTCQLSLPHKHLSKIHAKFQMMYPQSTQQNKRKRLYISDCSTNGVFVNNKKMGKGGWQLLEEADVIDFLPLDPKKQKLARVCFRLSYSKSQDQAERAELLLQDAQRKVPEKKMSDGPMMYDADDRGGQILGVDKALENIGDVYAAGGGYAAAKFQSRFARAAPY